MKNGGVGYGKISHQAPAALKKAVEAIREQIASGKIKVTAQSPPRHDGLEHAFAGRGGVSIPPLPVSLRPMTRRSTAPAAARSLVLAGCGGGDDDDRLRDDGDRDDGGDHDDRASRRSIRVGLVTDIGGLDDRSFNFLANKGLEQAEQELGVARPRPRLARERRLRPEPLQAGEAGLRPRDRGRLPDGRRRRHGREAVPGRRLRDRRLRPGGAEVEAARTCAGCSSRSRRPATSSATSPGSSRSRRRARGR